ncbi:hypothetical protein RKE29_08790 [Streptomyces sp. B1866]|uniref:hypothetical protein n=1 Tax=Streptomyces sp. B1866 TaxID=3075431 RepID=UPI0028912375|nr:hypothetical protein [Streptomyces sp. B1866]MDT3396735.1 hypothetical protein [Streptomyces sp. B1866]
MAHTRRDRTPGKRSGRFPKTGRIAARRALRREVPSTVALLADEDAFAAMRRYATFRFADHGVYLRRMEGLLRTLSSQGVHTTIALFDPAEFAEFCADTRLDPDSPASRTRYTAEVAAAGATVAYEGQPLDRLVPRLLDAAEQRATWERASAALARAGGGPGREEAAGRAAFERASAALRALLAAAGPGAHHVVCSVPEGGTPMVGVLHAEVLPDGALRLAESDAVVLCTVLACGIASDGPGGIVLRTIAAGRPDTVRGWSLRDGWPRPLTEAEVFAAYCTDADTGEPIPPEPGVVYRPGLPVPEPDGRAAPHEAGPRGTGPGGTARGEAAPGE